MLEDRVLVRPDKADEVTKGGLYLPETSKERPARGVVVEAGSGTTDSPMLLSVGDRVVYSKYAGTEIEINEERCLIMRQSEVLGVISDEGDR